MVYQIKLLLIFYCHFNKCLSYKPFHSSLKLQQNKLECFPLTSLKFVGKADAHSCGVPNNTSIHVDYLETTLAIKTSQGKRSSLFCCSLSEEGCYKNTAVIDHSAYIV